MRGAGEAERTAVIQNKAASFVGSQTRKEDKVRKMIIGNPVVRKWVNLMQTLAARLAIKLSICVFTKVNGKDDKREQNTLLMFE